MKARIASAALFALLVSGQAHAYPSPVTEVGPISDESWKNDGYCDSGKVVQYSRCDGDYCDDMYLECGTPYTSAGSVVASGSGSWIPADDATTSDENYSSGPWAECSFGQAVTGLWASGDWSDNIRVECKTVSLPPSTYPCYWTYGWSTSFYSDEAGWSPSWDAGNNAFVAGYRCNGSYCDNMQQKVAMYTCFY